MTYNIAGLKVYIPDISNLSEKSKDYEDDSISENDCDIYIDEDRVLTEIRNSSGTLNFDDSVYLFSGTQFYKKLLKFNGMMLHASAVKYKGKAYLFSGPCGMGKTTHTKLWKENFPGACVINDDKPALRLINGKWMAYGTPWCGKDGINENDSAPVGGICFLEKGDRNEMGRLEPKEAIPLFIEETVRSLGPNGMNKMLELLDNILRNVPVYMLTSVADMDAAILSKNIMADGL